MIRFATSQNELAAQPRGISDIQSYSLIIRDGIHDVIAADPFFANYTIRKNKMMAVKAELLPYLGIYFVDEVMPPDGDANAGCIRFSHTTRIGFSAMVANSDPVQGELQVDAAYWRIMHALWTNEKLMNVCLSSLPDNVEIESVTRGTRRHVFGAQNVNNETPVIEMQYEASVFYRSLWYPEITDTLNEIVVTTGIKIGDSQNDMDMRQQIKVVYSGLNFVYAAANFAGKGLMKV